MSRLTPAERSFRASIGGHALHAQVDSVAHTAPARAAFLAKFDDEVDPNGELSPEERARRAEHARKVYFKRLALKSVQSRRKAAG